MEPVSILLGGLGLAFLFAAAKKKTGTGTGTGSGELPGGGGEAPFNPNEYGIKDATGGCFVPAVTPQGTIAKFYVPVCPQNPQNAVVINAGGGITNLTENQFGQTAVITAGGIIPSGQYFGIRITVNDPIAALFRVDYNLNLIPKPNETVYRKNFPVVVPATSFWHPTYKQTAVTPTFIQNWNAESLSKGWGPQDAYYILDIEKTTWRTNNIQNFERLRENTMLITCAPDDLFTKRFGIVTGIRDKKETDVFLESCYQENKDKFLSFMKGIDRNPEMIMMNESGWYYNIWFAWLSDLYRAVYDSGLLFTDWRNAPLGYLYKYIDDKHKTNLLQFPFVVGSQRKNSYE